MQKYWLPFRNLENFDKNTTLQSTANAEPIIKKFLNSNDLIEAPAKRHVQFAKTVTFQNDGFENVLNEKPQAAPSRHSEDLTEGQINRDERNQHSFTTALIYANLNKDRKRPSTPDEEPARKKFQNNNGSIIEASTARNESTKIVNVQSEVDKNSVKPQVRYENKFFINKRCLSGDVGQILTLNKKCPSLDAFCEIYANILRIDNSKVGQKNLLLRNNAGPVLKGTFYEIDIKMIEVKVGDAVRCVGKLVDNSWLHIFKLSKMEYNKQLVPRLYTLTNFVIGNSKNSNVK